MLLSQKSSIMLNMENQMIDIYFKNLSYEIQTRYRKSSKKILKNLSGTFKAGELTGIMGPSGAGKSTLLNLLSGFNEKQLTGTIEYIGCNDKQQSCEYKKQLCYIQQTDYLHDLFTVQESMMIASQLKVNKNAKKRQMGIDNILNNLNLMTAKNTPVKQLSGGQKKRLSIALEMINNPPMMFLDEPTTGLDSMSSLHCISALKSLTKSGRTIICTIHQPSTTIYEMFDYIYLIVDGQCMYVGTPKNTITYFAQQGFQCSKYHNPADYMLDVMNQEYGTCDKQQFIIAASYCQREQLKNVHKNSLFNENIKQLSISSPTETTKCWILIRRGLLLIHRNWVTTHRAIAYFFVSILLGLLFEKAGQDAEKTFSNVGLFSISLIFLTYTTMMPAALTFPTEMYILRKERFNSWYQLKTYYIAILVIDLSTHLIFALIYSSTVYLLSQSLELYRFFMFFLILTLTTFIANSIGLGLGAVFTPVNSIFIGSVSVATMLILSGYLCIFAHMPRILYYVSYLNYMRFSFDGLMQAIYGFQRETLTCNKFYCHYQIPLSILKELDLLKSIFWHDIIILFGWFAIIRMLVYIVLKRNLLKLK